jgi:hypothetical protein
MNMTGSHGGFDPVASLFFGADCFNISGRNLRMACAVTGSVFHPANATWTYDIKELR